MSISATAIWCIAAIILLGAEMMAGTIYLLICAIACFTGALFAFLGLGLSAQLFVAGTVLVTGCCLVFVLRKKIKAQYRENLNDLDKGQRVRITELNADGSAIVHYRGTIWRAEGVHGPLSPGLWEIQKADGPRLLLEKKLN